MFSNREQAGELLADELKKKGYGKDAAVFAIPRGGVVTGRVIARALGCLLDIVVIRKIPAPNQPELAIGAVGPGGVQVIDVDLAQRSGVTNKYLKEKIAGLIKEVKEREVTLRGNKKPPRVKNRIIIIVDDGLATGATVEAGVRYLRQENPEKIVLAVPVASGDSLLKLEGLVDDVVVLEIPEDFIAVGQWYREFGQVTDEEVIQLLKGS